MIEMTVSKTSKDPSVFTLSPSTIELGGRGSNLIDKLHVNFPEEWDGMKIRVTFSYRTINGVKKIPAFLEEGNIVKLKSDMTACNGDIEIDAAGTDTSAAYSTGCHYTVYGHPDAGGSGQSVTPDEYHQFVSEVKDYSDSAQANATAADESKKASALSEQNSKSSETAAKAAQGAAETNATAAQRSAKAAAGSATAAQASANKAIEYTTAFQNPGYHNSIYRGKDISANEADGSMYTNIANGTFDDIFVGDYFHKTVNGQNYVFQILGCDIKMNRGSTPLTAHHIVVMPTTSFGSYKMNDTNTTDGGYVGSKMYTNVLPVWAGYLSNAFGSHLITSKELLVNATSSGSPSGWSWFDSTVNLMTVEEVLGHGTFGISHYEYYFNIGISYSQLPLFQLSPDKICKRYATYWLRNIPQSTFFSTVNNEGYAHVTPASASAELRPYFLLG